MDSTIISPVSHLLHSGVQEQLEKQCAWLLKDKASPAQLQPLREKLGILYWQNADYIPAANVFTQTLAGAEAVGDRKAIKKTLRILAEVKRDAGLYSQAKALYLRLLKMDKEDGNGVDTIADTNALAMSFYFAGRHAFSEVDRQRLFREAETNYQTALTDFAANGSLPKGLGCLVINSYAQLLIEKKDASRLHLIISLAPETVAAALSRLKSPAESANGLWPTSAITSPSQAIGANEPSKAQ